MVPSRNPENYFADVEQAAFSPGNFVPGIGPSPDKMLQARIISYHDADMGILENARAQFTRKCRAHDVGLCARIAVRSLSPDEAIGPKAGADFVIRKGKERVIEAAFPGARGQAFTDQPTSWRS